MVNANMKSELDRGERVAEHEREVFREVVKSCYAVTFARLRG